MGKTNGGVAIGLVGIQFFELVAAIVADCIFLGGGMSVEANNTFAANMW